MAGANRLSPSRCCAKGIHTETEVAPGLFKCIWCGAPRLQQPPTPPGNVGGCCDSLTRQANYPRPTITERRDDLATEIDERFRTAAREHARTRPGLLAWLAGNPSKTPEAYK
jgi:hypothetical protein